ncbi:MAG: hypothetical protein HQ582_09195 [Planctomycetes bacterium]|nr:hypothetical protein [Planctomycetota bacterium]
MAHSTQCPGCGEHYSVPAELAGKRVKCKKCGESFQVPPAQQTPEPQPGELPSEPLAVGESDAMAAATVVEPSGAEKREPSTLILSCPHCGGDCDGDATYCRCCGHRTKDFTPCRSCKEPIAKEATYCPFCSQAVPTDTDLAARSLQLTVRATNLGAFLTGGGLTGLFFPPIISVSQGRIRVQRWSFLGLRTHDQEIQVSRVASVRYTKGIIWGGLLVETFGGASDDLSEKGLHQDDARNMANQLKAVLSDRM